MIKSKRPSPRPSHPRRNVSIVGTGSYLPSHVLTNHDLEKMVDTNDDWITERTGIKERRIAAPDEFASDLGVKAAQEALRHAGLRPHDVDLIIVATSTPDQVYPSTACHLQHKLGATHCPAFDISAACAGFMYALITAEQFVATHMCDTVLVVGAEKYSTIINWRDRNTCVLFGDGAGAVVLQNRPHGHGILGADMGADGSQTGILGVPAGGCRIPITPEVFRSGQQYVTMNGREVYRHAVNAMIQSCERSLERAQLSSNDIRCVIPHQANMRIIASVAQKLGIPQSSFYVNLHRYGNMSAASIPVALHEASMEGRMQSGDYLLLVAFGGGLTWGSAVLEW